MIKYIITDFDGTLFDTKAANTEAYKAAFNDLGYVLNEDQYAAAFGLRFDEMCAALGVTENQAIRNRIKAKKAEYYKRYVSDTNINRQLFEFLKWQHSLGIKIAIASTARKENLENVLWYHTQVHPELNSLFDVIITGEDVENGKPDPEVYLKTMSQFKTVNDGGTLPGEVLVFEDTDVGVKAARDAGINAVCKIKKVG